MNAALNRAASEARMADLRRQAGRDAIALADIRAGSRQSSRLPAWMIAAILRLLQARRPTTAFVPRDAVDDAGAMP